MHGVIFASFSDFVTARFGADVARHLLEDEPVYLLSEAYEDERLFGLIGRASELVHVPAESLVRDFGVFTAQTTFTRLYPAFFEVAGAPRPFLLTIEDRIHELVRATIPNARPPQLQVSERGTNGVSISYTSARQLCVLLRGLVEGTARHYDETAVIEESTCMKRGDAACTFDVTLRPAPSA